MRRLVAIFLLAVAPAVSAEVSVGLEMQQFNWAESAGGKSMLEEHGPRFAANGYWRGWADAHWFVAARAKATYGDPRYDGHYWGGVAMSTESKYMEGDVRLTSGYRINFESKMALDFEGGLGATFWNRAIYDPSAGKDLEEDYRLYYLYTGAKLMESPESGWRIGAGVRWPGEVEENVHLRDIGGDTNPRLHPKARPQPEVEAGYRYQNWEASVFAAQRQYDKSKAEVTSIGTVFQPNSTETTFGLRVNYIF